MHIEKAKSRSKISKFALSLISFYSSKKDLSALLEDSESLLAFLSKYPEFQVFLSSPNVGISSKKVFISEVMNFFAPTHRYFSSTIFLLIQFGLISNLLFFLEELNSKLIQVLECKRVRVFSGSILSQSSKAKIKSELQHFIGSQYSIKIDYFIDPELFVGIRVEYGEMILECSLSKKLFQMKKELLEVMCNV